MPIFELARGIVALDDNIRAAQIHRLGSQRQSTANSLDAKIGIFRHVALSQEQGNESTMSNGCREVESRSLQAVKELSFQACVSGDAAFRLVHTVYYDGKGIWSTSAVRSCFPINDSVSKLVLEVAVEQLLLGTTSKEVM